MNNPQLYIFYHLFCKNDYFYRFERTFNKIRQSKLLDNVTNIFINCVGDYHIDDIIKIKKLSSKIIVSFGKNSKNESETINWIREFSIKNEQCNILYLHSKGVSRCFDEGGNKLKNYESIFDWIDMMEYFVIEHYDKCIDALNSGYDTCGSNKKSFSYYSGNFWWAKSSYIKKCGKCEDDYWFPELWLFKNKELNPKIKNFWNCDNITWEDWKRGNKRLHRESYNILNN